MTVITTMQPEQAVTFIYKMIIIFLEPGHEGPDCSVQTGVAPTVNGLDNNGTCDMNKRLCRQINVFARGTVDGSLKCRITKLKVFLQDNNHNQFNKMEYFKLNIISCISMTF